jgi:hypothetical protein
VFTRVFNTLRKSGTLPSAHVSSERQGQQHVTEVENILQLVERSAGTSSRRIFMRLGVSQSKVWRTLRDASCAQVTYSVYNTSNKETLPSGWNFFIG